MSEGEFKTICYLAREIGEEQKTWRDTWVAIKEFLNQFEGISYEEIIVKSTPLDGVNIVKWYNEGGYDEIRGKDRWEDGIGEYMIFKIKNNE